METREKILDLIAKNLNAPVSISNPVMDEETGCTFDRLCFCPELANTIVLKDGVNGDNNPICYPISQMKTRELYGLLKDIAVDRREALVNDYDGFAGPPEIADWAFDACALLTLTKEIESIQVPDDTEDAEIVVNLDKEYINDDIRRIGQFMWNEKDGTPKDPVRFDSPVAITLFTNGRGYLEICDFLVTAVLPGRDDIPMVEGTFENHDKKECLPLICHDTQNGHYYENRFWNVDNLKKTLAL